MEVALRPGLTLGAAILSVAQRAPGRLFVAATLGGRGRRASHLGF